jgi:hypothetical protein
VRISLRGVRRLFSILIARGSLPDPLRLLSRRVVDARGPAKAWPEPRGEGARPQRPAPVPRVREEGASGCFDQVAGTGRLTLSGVEVPKVPAARHAA